MAKKASDPKKKKKRDLIILAGLSLVLVLLAVIQGPKMLKKKTQTPATAASTTIQNTVATSSLPGTLAGTVPVVPSGELPESDVAYLPSQGQLSSLDRFQRKNPFRPELGQSTNTTGGSSSATTPTTATSSTTGTSTSSTAAEPYLSATIVVNGVSEEVNVKALFPAASPVFVLESAATSSVKISVSGGAFANGSSKITIEKGRTVTLVNTADGTKYKIKLVSTSKAAATVSTTTSTTGGPTPPTASTGATTTAPATTTR